MSSAPPSRKPSFVRKPSERKEIEPDGLSTQEAEELLLKYGRNELPRKKDPKILVFLKILAQPMPIMIWIAVIIELAIQDWLDAGILLLIQFANAGIAFYETTKAEDAVSALEGNLKPKTIVKRDARWNADFDASLLVVGDVVRLKFGAAVPADCEVISGNIDVDQSTLNGESLPKNMVAGAEPLMGTLVVRGEAVAVVRKTGANTSIGTTAALLKDTGELSNLQKTMNTIMTVLVTISITLCVIVLIDLLAARHIGISDALSFVVVLLVASVPLAIEIVTTTTLALGSRELSTHGAIVSRLTAIEDLSAMSILCSDKTGTLTMNKMKLQHQETVCYDMEDAAEEIALFDSFVPFFEAGNVDSAKDLAKPEHVNLSINSDSAAAALPAPASPLASTFHRQPLISDDVSRTSSKAGGKASPAGPANVEMQSMAGAPSSYPVPTYHSHLVRLGSLCIKWNEHEHEPLDTMMVNFLSNTEKAYMNHFYDQVEFHPFDPAIKRVSAKIQECDTGNMFTVTKGACEVLLKLVNNAAVSSLVLQDVYELGSRGIRAIGVATKQEPNGKWMMRGILPFLDPPREDTQPTLEQAAKKGVAVKMITGDSVLIARETARVLGLCSRPGQPCVVPSNKLPLLVGEEKKIPEGLARDYGDMCAAADGFGGVIPEHKFLIVQCLRDLGYRVGMTGDGVNDAPALKQADVGIAVEGAVAAAQKAAQIVLTQPGLSTIIVGIVTARRIFRRINNFFIYRISATLQLILFFFISVFLFIPTDYQPTTPCFTAFNANATTPLNGTWANFPCVCYPGQSVIGGGVDAGRTCLSEANWPPFFHLPVLMLMLITVLNDGTLISIGYDVVKERDIPERWNLKALFAISTLLAGVACVSSLLLLWMSLDSWRINGVYQATGIGEITFAQVATSLYLKVSISDFLTLFSARTGGDWFFTTRPSPILVTGGCIALSISSILANTWPSSTTDGVLVVGLAYRSPQWLSVFIWIYCLVFWLIQDSAKVLLFYLMTKYNWFGVNDTGTFFLSDSAIRYRDAVLDNVAALEATVEIKEHGGGAGQAPHSVALNFAARPQAMSANAANPLEFEKEEEGEEEDDAPMDRTVSSKAVRKSFSVAHIRKLNAMTPPRSRKPTLNFPAE